MLPSDAGFVASCWVKTARAANRNLDSGLFNRWHFGVVAKLLDSPGVRVMVAGPPDDDATVYGFVVLEGACVHCVYVRESLRRLGVAKALLQGVALEEAPFTLLSRDVRDWVLQRFPRLRHTPLWLWEFSKEPVHGRSREAA